MNTVSDYISRVTELQLHQNGKSPEYYIAGPVNSGKSTLVNGLIGQRICPDDPSPSTMFPVYFNYSRTFSASRHVNGKNIPVPQEGLRDTLKNRRRASTPDRADIQLPSGLLRWCSLVDTPGTGLSGETDGLLLDRLARADGIVFLFHQRGMDSATGQFLTRLAGCKIKGWISFWINANLGLIDGTSLTDTAQALKTIFPGRSEVFAINARDKSSTGLVSLYLQVRAMEAGLREFRAGLEKKDRTIPGMLARASMQTDDGLFLTRLWDVVNTAELIISGREAIRELPLIHGSLVNMLQANTARLTLPQGTISTRGTKAGQGGSGQETLFSLIKKIRAERDLAPYCRGESLLKRLEMELSRKVKVIAAGPFSTGKTTFLNALLGETLLPAEDRATTSCPVRVGYGDEKMAEIKQLSQVEFSPLALRNGKYTLNREELLAITRILEDPSIRGRIGGAEICRDGSRQSVSLAQLTETVDEICRSYSREAASGANPRKILRIPLFSRSIAPKLLPGPAVTSIRLTLKNRGRQVFRLDEDSQRLEFYRAISPPGSFLAERVSISHPSANLALADFIDTPGLDSLHKRHLDSAMTALSPGSLTLVFLHARHVQTEGISGDIMSVLKSLGPNSQVFYVLNFADTISGAECERVSLYVRQRLVNGSGNGEVSPYPQVYAISALNALRHGDDGFNRLMRRIRKRITDMESGRTGLAVRQLSGWLEKVSSGEKNGRTFTPGRAREAADHYLKELGLLQKKLLHRG